MVGGIGAWSRRTLWIAWYLAVFAEAGEIDGWGGMGWREGGIPLKREDPSEIEHV